MLDKTTHPFIANTLAASSNWHLVVHAPFYQPGVFVAELEWEGGPGTSADGSTLSEALDRLESLLAGREPL